MRIRKRLIDILEPSCAGHVVRDVRIGLGYTAVQLDDGRTGAAYTLGRELLKGCTSFAGKRPIAGSPAVECLRYLDSEGLVESSVGLATANALANTDPAQAVTGDVLKAVKLWPTDAVAMVGFFGPLVAQLEDQVADLEIFEEQTGLFPHLRHSSEAAGAIPKFDVAIITSTTIINDTIDELLEAARDCRELVMLGSSTPLSTEAFEDSPVTLLSGISIDDPEGLLRVVSEGGGTRFFGPFVTKRNIPLRSRASADVPVNGDSSSSRRRANEPQQPR